MTRIGFILVVASALAAMGAVQTADVDYQKARASYYALKKDHEKRKLRHHWLNVAKKFDWVAAKYPKSPRAPEALFTSAELYSELSRFSRQEEDLRAALTNYQRLWETYPKHNLADDALVSSVKIFMDRKPDAVKAFSVMKHGMAKVKVGDKKKELLALKAYLPVPVSHSAPPKQIVRQPPAVHAQVASQQMLQVLETSSPSTTDKALSEETNEETNVGASTEAVAEEEIAAPALGPSTVSKWQESLRDVRVGADASVTEDKSEGAEDAKSRLKNLPLGKSEVTLADQLGLKVRRVVLDAGHGGHDAGASGPRGTREKDVTLAITKKLAALLRNSGLEVALTREKDEYVRLEDRTKFGNDVKGDLFVSIHCNASPNRKSQGVETYTLNTSADRYAIRLAARENASSEKGISDLQYILADLATKANTEESNRLADQVQGALVSSLREKNEGIKNLGRKEALFFVLLGARMPAILVETSFISNPQEERLLASSDYQAEVASAIAVGIRSFIDDRERLAQSQTQ